MAVAAGIAGMATDTAPAPAVPALYVGDLHRDITDAGLFELFSSIGAVTSVRVCRDALTMGSLGYGYVNYISAEDAQTAIEKLNHIILFGKPIRIMWSSRDPDSRNSGIGNVFVKNLGGSVDSVKLQEMFEKFGNILSSKVVTHDGKSKGYGFVQFDSQDSANSAIESLNDTIVDGKRIFVGNFIKKSERFMPNAEVKYTNLYMKNLDQDITEDLIELKFSEFGKISNVMIAKDGEGKSKGFGFVNFENPDSAKKAMEAMNGLQLGSKTLYVARAQKKEERQQILRRIFEEKRREQIRKNMASNLYVKNIDESVDENALREQFRRFGSITSAKIMHDAKGISKGFGFVCYTSPEEALQAVNILHGYMFHGKPLYVAIAQRKEERQAQLQLKFSQRMSGLASVAAPTVISTGYPPLYYSPPTPFLPTVPARPGLMYQPFGLRQGWRPTGFVAPPRTTFQPIPFPVIPNTPRQQRQTRGRMNEHLMPQSGHPWLYRPHGNYLKDSNGQQARYLQNGRHGDMSNVPPPAHSASSNPQETEMLSSMLAAAPLQQQKQMLGERLFPLIQKLKEDMAAKITGMLLEMDNSELLLLLESPESLTAKVEEAVQVLKLSKTTTKAGGQESLHPNNFLSAEVAVN
ncbi:putative polyadenylate-binding protein [Platanthera zijinensis]|uniref:Polyadenylate-binding protein n=1 Tax=Platanthera zijinensis TaxID=2320716 RepID=A0AAP0C591_9ASPA